MNATNIQFVRNNEVNDIFSYLDKNNELQYTYFLRTMRMSIEDVKNYLND
jgi:hypothetical protein